MTRYAAALSFLALMTLPACAPAQEFQAAAPPAAAPAGQDPAAASPLKVRKIVVYKHGVGYFEREGKVRGDQQVSLSFKSGQMKDLLKSLFAVDLSGGRIAAISYDTKDPLSKQLEDILIRIPEGNALTQFLSQLKGARVEATVGGDTAAGSIVGIEPVVRQTKEGTVTSYKLVLFRDDGRLQPVDLLEMSHLKLQDEALQKDLRRILEIHLKAKHADRKSVVLNCAGQGERDVRVGYIIETPIWKTSYRLLFDEGQKPLLQGWAILENATEEDWEQVDVSFVAGSPMSFIMDLYTAYYPERAEIPVGMSVAPKPEAAPPAPPMTAAPAAKMRALKDSVREKADAAEFLGRRAGEARKSFAEELELNAAPAAAGVEVGDLFAYQAREKVSLRRGQAALVPILSERLEGGERVLHWRPGTARPTNSFYFSNSTALTLESGPVTFFDGSTCVGEGLMRKVLKKGMKDMMPYAVEAGVTVETKVNHRSDPVTRGTVANGVLTLTYVQNLESVYVVKSQLSKDTVLYLDHPRSGGYALAEPAKPAEEVEGVYRFRLELKAGASTELKVRETTPVSQQVALLQTPAETIRFYMSQRYLSAAARKFMEELMAAQGEINRLRAEENDLAQERARLNEDDGRVRQNLSALRDSAQEAELRSKYIKRLQESDTRLEQIRTEIKERAARRAGLERELSRKVQEFKEE
jgi:hypothetical protein